MYTYIWKNYVNNFFISILKSNCFDFCFWPFFWNQNKLSVADFTTIIVWKLLLLEITVCSQCTGNGMKVIEHHIPSPPSLPASLAEQFVKNIRGSVQLPKFNVHWTLVLVSDYLCSSFTKRNLFKSKVALSERICTSIFLRFFRSEGGKELNC